MGDIMSFMILGNQRSGTSYLLDLINAHPSVDTINEPFSMHLNFFRTNESAWSVEEFDERYLHRELKCYPKTCSFIKELNHWLNFDFPNIRGFKETALFEKYDWLCRVLDIDQTIVVMRDLRAVIYSVLRRKLHRSWWDYEGRLRKYYGYTDILEDHIICAELLKHRTNHLIEIIQKTNCYVLRLEDLLNEPLKELNELMKYIGAHVSDEQISFFEETSKETRDSTYSNFRRKEDVLNKWKIGFEEKIVKEINDILQEELSYFGYEI